MRQTPLPNSLWPDSCSTGSFPKSTVTFPDICWQPWSDPGLLLDTPNYSRESGIWLGESAGNQWSPQVLETQTSSTSCSEMKADPSSLTKEALLDAVWQEKSLPGRCSSALPLSQSDEEQPPHLPSHWYYLHRHLVLPQLCSLKPVVNMSWCKWACECLWLTTASEVPTNSSPWRQTWCWALRRRNCGSPHRRTAKVLMRSILQL